MSCEADELIESLFREEYSKLLCYANSIIKDPARSEDVVQDTFHEAVRRKDVLREHENPAAWLMETLKNKIRCSNRSHNRYLIRIAFLEAELGIEDEHIAQIEEDPKERLSSVLKCVQQTLTEEEYQLLKRLIFDKVGHTQAAKELGISVWACQKRLERIRRKLKKVFPQKKKLKNFQKICQLLLLVAIYG